MVHNYLLEGKRRANTLPFEEKLRMPSGNLTNTFPSPRENFHVSLFFCSVKNLFSRLGRKGKQKRRNLFCFVTQAFYSTCSQREKLGIRLCGRRRNLHNQKTTRRFATEFSCSPCENVAFDCSPNRSQF